MLSVSVSWAPIASELECYTRSSPELGHEIQGYALYGSGVLCELRLLLFMNIAPPYYLLIESI